MKICIIFTQIYALVYLLSFPFKYRGYIMFVIEKSCKKKHTFNQFFVVSYECMSGLVSGIS